MQKMEAIKLKKDKLIKELQMQIESQKNNSDKTKEDIHI